MPPEDDIGSLEKARANLYKPDAPTEELRVPLTEGSEHTVPHAWEGPPPAPASAQHPHVRIAVMFFTGTFVFFLIALAAAGYFFYFGGNSVSVDKIAIDIQGPTTIAGGDTVSLSVTITNKNPVAIDNATIEIGFPEGSRDAANVLQAYPRYTENLGTLPSGVTITRSIKVVVFGEAGQMLSLPISFSYGTTRSSATFEKKSSYALAISSTPLSLSVTTLTETVSGKPLTLTLAVRSNATTPLTNVVLAGAFPFGFSVVSSSIPLSESTFTLGTLQPGQTKTITLVGTLSGQENEQRVFRFTLGTAKSADDQTLAVTYMTQNTTVAITAPFLDATISLNGDTSSSVITPQSNQSATVSYTNTLPTNITNATIAIAILGSAVDYDSIRTTSGFYRSLDHTIIFSKDTDPSLAQLAPGASGIGTFTFSTLSPETLPPSPTITFTISVSGTRVGQSNVPEAVNSSVTRVLKVATTVVFTASSLHTSAPFSTSGPIPPRANEATTYAIVLNVRNRGSAVAGGVVSTTLPSYVSYAGKTSGPGSFSYNESSREVTWNTGDLAQGGSAQGAFLVSLTPSSSQRGDAPALTGSLSFSGYDRFAGVQVGAVTEAVTTQTTGDPGYISIFGTVQ